MWKQHKRLHILEETLSKIVCPSHQTNSKQQKQAPESRGEESVSRVITMYCIQFSKKNNYEIQKEIGQCDPYAEKNSIEQVTETAHERIQMLNITEKLQSRYCEDVQRTNGNYAYRSKGNYDDNVSSN